VQFIEGVQHPCEFGLIIQLANQHGDLPLTPLAASSDAHAPQPLRPGFIQETLEADTILPRSIEDEVDLRKTCQACQVERSLNRGLNRCLSRMASIILIILYFQPIQCYHPIALHGRGNKSGAKVNIIYFLFVDKPSQPFL
jgi:hypothetical protein